MRDTIPRNDIVKDARQEVFRILAHFKDIELATRLYNNTNFPKFVSFTKTFDTFEALIPIINMITEDWLKRKSLHERNTMITWALRARVIITCAYVSLGVAYVILVGMPIFGKSMRLTSNITDPGRPMPLQTYYIYDITRRPQYELTFLSQIISCIFATIPYTAIDNFLGLLTFHICGQLVILKNRLTHIHEYKNFREALRDCIVCHIRLLR